MFGVVVFLFLFLFFFNMDLFCWGQFSSVTQSCLILWSHGLQRARLPCPPPTPGVYPNPCPLSRWCHPTISSSVVPFSSCSQPLPASGSFPMSQLFASGGQSIGVSAVISFRMDWLDILAVQRTLKSLLQHHSSKASILRRSAFFIVQLSHPYMTTGKTIVLIRWTFVDKKCLWFLICYLGWSQLSFQGVSVF